MSTEILILWLLAVLVGIFFAAIGKLKLKKKIAVFLLLVALGVSGILLYAESRFGTSTVVECDLSAEEILAEMPDISITEDDIAMGKALWESEEIADAFLLAEADENGKYNFPFDKGSELLAQRIPEGFDVRYFCVSVDPDTNERDIDIILIKDGKQRIDYWFSSDLNAPRSKLIKTYNSRRIFDEATTYVNYDGEITKREEKRLWFYWLTNKLTVSE